jgi:hypothetical protein
VDELVLPEGGGSQSLSSLTLASSSVYEYLLSSPRRKIPGSSGVPKNSRLRWSSETFKDQVGQTVPPSAIISNSSSFCHHPKQLLLPRAIVPNNLSLLTPGPNIALLMHLPSLKVHILIRRQNLSSLPQRINTFCPCPEGVDSKIP